MLWRDLSVILRQPLSWAKNSVIRTAVACQLCSKGIQNLTATKPLLHCSPGQLLSQRTSSQPLWTQVRGMKSRRNPHTESQQEEWKKRNKTILTYITAAGVGMIGISYAAVPLYRLYCQASGLGGTAVVGHDAEKVESMTPVKDRILKITFNADVHAGLQWNFRPQQSEVYVAPGETALAFYKAKNPTDKPVIGISTYNVVPFEAGQYFNKIQCFCFEEQRLNPNEEVDMPVFFYIDPEFDDDPRMARVDTITLSYTFLKQRKGRSCRCLDIAEGNDGWGRNSAKSSFKLEI